MKHIRTRRGDSVSARYDFFHDIPGSLMTHRHASCPTRLRTALVQQRELPPGLSDRDKKYLKRVKKHARRLDKGFSLCGMRFGWTAIIGLIPMAGDAADALLNYTLVIRNAKQCE